MDCRLVTQSNRADGIFGELFDDDEIHVCFTLEHSFITANNGARYQPLIPRWRTYVCVKGLHTIAGDTRERFEITGVEGHTGLVIHKGLLNNDSKGCPLLGEDLIAGDKGWTLVSSGASWDKFMALQGGLDQFLLTVE